MRTFDEIAKEVGYDLKAQCPHQLKKKYYAYKKGEVCVFDTMADARACSKNTEAVPDPDTEILRKAWYEEQKYKASLAADKWRKELREAYDVSDEVFNYCYSKAYSDHHGDGYDSIAECVEDCIFFATDIINLGKLDMT